MTTFTQSICQKGPLVLLTVMVLGLLYERLSIKSGSADIVEPFWMCPNFVVRTQAQDENGDAKPTGNQQQLYLPPVTNPRPPGSLMSLTNPASQCPPCHNDKSTPSIKKTPLAEKFSPSSSVQRVNNYNNDGSHFSAQNSPESNIPLYRQGDNLDFVQVPGTFQSNPPPRFSNESLGATVRYNIPSSKNLAFDPKNPLPYAQMVEKPKVKENFDAGSFQYSLKSPSQRAINQTTALTDQHGTAQRTDTVEVRLPEFSMSSRGEYGVSDKQANISYDRFMVANPSRQRAGSDYIRGDIPCIPQLPVLDKNSFIMFRPSSGPEVLNSGAMHALGASGGTFVDTLALKFQNNGGATNTGAGGKFAPSDTAAQVQSSVPSQTLNQTLSHVANNAKRGSTIFGDSQYSTAVDIPQTEFSSVQLY